MDLGAAYDTVQWSLIWQILQRLGTHGHMLSAVQGVYSNRSLAMKVNGCHGTAQFPPIGQCQRCPLSATLFGLFLDGLREHIQTSVPGAGIEVQRIPITDMEYADDVFVLGSSSSELQDLINVTFKHCEALHMQITAPKTKFWS